MDYSNTYFRVFNKENKVNIIKGNGEYISDQWFDAIGINGLSQGYWYVRNNDKYNYIDKEGNILSPNQWFDEAFDFVNRFARVTLNGKWNLINTRGELLFKDQWQNALSDMSVDGYFLLYKDKNRNKVTIVDEHGEFLKPNLWFDQVVNSYYTDYTISFIFQNAYATVRVGEKFNLIDRYGNYISNQWFDDVAHFCNGYVLVYSADEDGYNFLNRNGELISKEWFKKALDFNENGIAFVCTKDKKKNYINGNGEVINDKKEIVNIELLV